LQGWFEDTLATAPIEQLALLRLDGDLYSSTIQTLDALFDKVSVGGFVVVDDYGSIPACKQATDDFRSRRSIEDPIEVIDWAGVYWRKTRA
jgi:O-methyltransferase